jgi:hypothetical protein
MDVGGFAVPMASTAAGPSARCARLISPTVAAGALPMDVLDDTPIDRLTLLARLALSLAPELC